MSIAQRRPHLLFSSNYRKETVGKEPKSTLYRIRARDLLNQLPTGWEKIKFCNRLCNPSLKLNNFLIISSVEKRIAFFGILA